MRSPKLGQERRAAVSINLGSCEIGALYDDHVNAIVGIDGTEESVLCMAVVGIPA